MNPPRNNMLSTLSYLAYPSISSYLTWILDLSPLLSVLSINAQSVRYITE
jgi:hypothetical protein